MANRDDELRELEEALAAEGQAGDSLSDEIARRWDPERLSKLVSKRAGRGQSLDAMTRARYEKRLGADLSRVRIYSGEFAERVTKAHAAEAITVGSTGIILMSGTPERSPITTAGRQLLAHELTHVAQAQRGLHPSSTGFELATEENEQAAQEQERVEEQTDKQPQQDDPALVYMLRDLLFERVLRMLEEEDRLMRERNGDYPVRP